MSLQNRTVVITGATGGLGSALARDLADQGANLALIGRDLAELESLAQSLALPAGRVMVQSVDLLDGAATHAAAEAIASSFGQVDALLHVVGGWVGGKTLLDTPPTDLEFMLNQHVWTSFNATRSFLPHMIKNGWGRIVMITSPAGSRPNAKSGAYAIGKAGQETLMLTLSQELKGTGVTANVLQVRAIDAKRAKISAPDKDNASWTTPEELTAAVRYLLSDEAGTISGAKLPMYGSYS